MSPARLLARLTKFVALRFKHSSLQSNLQFQIDLGTCGLTMEDIGKVEAHDWDSFPFYVWPLPALDGYRLAEFGGRLFLMPEYLPLPECLKPRSSPQPRDQEPTDTTLGTYK